MRVFDFSHAIVRAPAASVVNGIRADTFATPRYEEIAREHMLYVAALREAGLAVDILPPLEAFPDSVFVEDPALVFSEGAILLRPGAPARFGEIGPMREALQGRFSRVLTLEDGQFADGGDVLVTPETVFIGLSARTNRAGAEALASRLAEFGRKTAIVSTPQGILHFKTAVSLLGETTVLAMAAMAESGLFADFDIIEVPEDEEAAANALRVNKLVLIGENFPRTCEKVAKAGFDVVPLPVTEIGTLDAGLSCMSLRWLERP